MERTLRALQASEARTRELIEESGDGILVSEASGRYVEVNPALCRMLGYSRQQLLSMHAGDLTAADDPVGNDGMDERLAEATGELGILVERRYRKRDGTSVPVEVRFKVLPDGRQQRNVRDISDRIRAEAALRESEEHHRLLVEESADGVFHEAPDGHFIDVNRAGCEMLGYARDELLARGIQDVVDAQELGRDLLPLPRLQAGETVTVEQRFRRRDGSMVVGELRARLLSDGTLLANVRDVTARREAQANAELVSHIDRAMTDSVRQVPAEAGLEEAAQHMCATLADIPGIDFVAIEGFVNGDEVIELAHIPPGFPTPLGGGLPAHRARFIREARGPFARYWRAMPEDGAWGEQVSALSLKAVAVAPIVHGDHVDGSIVVGTADEGFAHMLVERMPGLASLGAVSSGLFAVRMHARRDAAELRTRVEGIVTSCSFHPVFQPIVDLESGEVVGYEALTRFDSGQRPDLCFADAWSVGLGRDLELATLEAAIAAGRQLPAGRWLDLNVSPRVLEDPDRLGAVLWTAERPIVLEVTEHDVIEDYDVVHAAIRALGHDIRLAVDDAGAGVANFGHIIELHPDFVKLDISLVRQVNANVGRQAMVVGMRHFSRTAGCRLVAEGIETDEEARTLTDLGVEFGQGYLFGHPEPAEAWASSRS